MLEFLKAIDENLLFGSLPLLVAGIFVFKRCNSYVASLLLLFVYDFFSREVHQALMDWIVAHLNGNHRYMMWFGFWFVADMLFVYGLLFIHKRLILPFSEVANLLTNVCMLRCLLHIIIYTNMVWIESTAVLGVYNYSIPAMNIGVLITLTYFLVRSARDSRANVLFYYG